MSDDAKPIPKKETPQDKMHLLRMRTFANALERMLKDYMTPPRDMRFTIIKCDIDTDTLKMIVEWDFVPITQDEDENDLEYGATGA